MPAPEPDRRCQCKKTFCECKPCRNDMTQEDLLCDDCRKSEEGTCCHDASRTPYSVRWGRPDDREPFLKFVRDRQGIMHPVAREIKVTDFDFESEGIVHWNEGKVMPDE